MKNIFSLLLVIISSLSFAQQKKIQETSFEVKGNCKMCKARIEEAALHLKGVKFAEWNKDTDILSIAYRPDKIELDSIHKQIALIGHTTNKMEANTDAYEMLPNCCKYKSGVVCDH